MVWGGPVLSGDQKPVFHASMEQASQAAEMDQSLVLVVFRASWCVFSKEFNKTTLNNAEFTQAPILVHVVPVDTDANAALSQEFNVGALPDLVLLTPWRQNCRPPSRPYAAPGTDGLA